MRPPLLPPHEQLDSSASMQQAGLKSKSTKDSLWQQCLLGRLGVRDLVDDEAHSTLGDDVGDAVADLDVDDGAASTKANHWEQVDNWVCAPANDGPHLGLLNLGLDDWVLFLGCSSGKADQELVHDVEEEAHGKGPAKPAWGQVTCDDE